MDKENTGLYSVSSIIIAFAATLLYLLCSFYLIGFKTDQLVLTTIFNICFFLSPDTRKFITAFSIFIVYWILFDYMKAFPNYTFNTVHIKDLYDIEKWWFGINYDDKILTPNEYWLQNSRTWLDILSGFFYLCWIPVPLIFAAYLFFKDKMMFLHFSFTFVLVNFLGFIIYYVYPAAPPWYYQINGNDFIPGTAGNTAGLHRFDDFFNSRIFHNIYEKSSNVFAAMPSLHSSYMLIVLYYAMKKMTWWVNLVFGTITLGIWFAAVYSSHHYVADVIAGIACAFLGIFLFQKSLLHSNYFNRFLVFYSKII